MGNQPNKAPKSKSAQPSSSKSTNANGPTSGSSNQDKEKIDDFHMVRRGSDVKDSPKGSDNTGSSKTTKPPQERTEGKPQQPQQQQQHPQQHQPKTHIQDDSTTELFSPPSSSRPQEPQLPVKPTQSTDVIDSIPLEIAPEDIQIAEFLGEGVYSEVYKGSCYGTQVAVKKFKNQGFDPEVLKEVRKEVRIMKSIRHPNLLLFLGACTKPGHLMIVTELMAGSFHDVTTKQKASLLQKLRMAKEAAKGISWLHSLSPAIIHRDLKPENILIDHSGLVVKVADFGLSLVKDHSKQEAEEMRKIRGSPAFMSPEALLGEELTPKTDVYSFGVILWELLTSSSPYEHLEIETFEQLIEEICERHTREKVPDDCPPTLRKLIEACWQHHPASRPAFLQIISVLDDCLAEVAVSDSEGRRMWKTHFLENGSLMLEVPWNTFVIALASHLHMNPSMKVFQGLKAVLVKNDKDMVSMEEFGNILKWFGPIDTGSDEQHNFLIAMQNLFTKRWFHGDISVEASQTLLAQTEPGTFLIRFSSNPGSYALSKIIENQTQERVIVHIRINHKPGDCFSFVLDGQVHDFKTLDDLVKCPLLSLGNPCPGSKYYAQFRMKQNVVGYINYTN